MFFNLYLIIKGLYEVRVSVGTNEYRTILVAVDTSSFMESKKVVFLNSFL